MSATGRVHATALVIGEAGVLIRGGAGAGKTALALACIATVRSQGRFAALVSDDRVCLLLLHGRLVARVHPAIAGQVERRGLMIEAAGHLPSAVLRLVVDLVSDPQQAAKLPRLPWTGPSKTPILTVQLPHLPLDAGRQRADQVALILAALQQLLT